MAWVVQIAAVAFTVARLTRLVCADEIGKPIRALVAQRRPEGSLLTYLVFCRWCVSIWIALPAASAWWLLSPLPRWSGRWWVDVPTVALALSYATGLLVRAEREP